jgi:hypothetical protein
VVGVGDDACRVLERRHCGQDEVARVVEPQKCRLGDAVDVPLDGEFVANAVVLQVRRIQSHVGDRVHDVADPLVVMHGAAAEASCLGHDGVWVRRAV